MHVCVHSSGEWRGVISVVLPLWHLMADRPQRAVSKQGFGVVYQWLPHGYDSDGWKARMVNTIG